MRITIIILCLCTFSLYAQKETKIDSTFTHYFNILDLEMMNDVNVKNNTEVYNEIVLDDGSKVFVNKYANEAIQFLQKISGIDAPKKYVGGSIAHYANEETLTKWKEWYKINREKISWCKRRQVPCMSFWRRLFG